MERAEALAILHAAGPVEPWHVDRYLRSFGWVTPWLVPGARVLDVGGRSPFTALLASTGARIETTGDADLRLPLAAVQGPYDVITCMEVIEHLKDRDSCERATFSGSGMRSLLAELRRLAAPAGRLFLTTPNLCCWHGVRRLLRGEHPHQYPLHVREMPPAEVRERVAEAGWRIERDELVSVWNDHHVPPVDRERISRLAIELAGSDALLRGDCFFLLAAPGPAACSGEKVTPGRDSWAARSPSGEP